MIINPNGIELDIEDDPKMGIIELVKREIETYYELDVDYKPDDLVLDIGAQVGIVSCYLGKRYPFLKIQAFEPVYENYRRAYRNMRVNHVYATLWPCAVTGDGRKVSVHYSKGNSGSHSIYLTTGGYERVRSMSIVKMLDCTPKVRMVKIDCEGAEYEIFEALEQHDLLKKIQSVRGELHGLPGKSIDGLVKMLERHIPDVRMAIGGPIGG